MAGYFVCAGHRDRRRFTPAPTPTSASVAKILRADQGRPGAPVGGTPRPGGTGNSDGRPLGSGTPPGTGPVLAPGAPLAPGAVGRPGGLPALPCPACSPPIPRRTPG